MAITYYQWDCGISPNSAPSGSYTYDIYTVVVTAAAVWRWSSVASSRAGINLSGDTAEWASNPGQLWFRGESFIDNLDDTELAIFDVGSLSGVTGLGLESPLDTGIYYTENGSGLDTQVFTPVKAGYAFSPTSFTFDSVQGHAVRVTFEITNTSYKVTNPGPEDDAIDVNRVTNLTWDEGADAADDYDVWFGTPGNMVLVGTEVTDKFFDIADYTGGLALDTEYEWRIDSYIGGIRIATGDVWSYTTRAQRTVVLSSPDNLSENNYTTGLLISWTIDGIGAQYGSFEDQDFLFIYLRKDDANFTEDDLIGNFVQAFVNDDLTISRLEHDTLYYWQVQAGNTAADLADSEVWSFTTMTFRPPAVPTSGGEPIGINNMLTRKRFIAAANNKMWYEDI